MNLLTRQNIGLALVRIAIGITFLAHGSQKLFVWGVPGVANNFAQMGIPLPTLSAYLATAAEFGGGLFLLLGLYTRLAAIPVAFTMLVALHQVHFKGGFFLPTGFEYVLVLLASTIALGIAGGGAFALDNLRVRRATERGEGLRATGSKAA
ncbi:MAG TPA: DoxX family protein [Clostridia bacterium]|nr:DoxX family protein [Clostridia bacterium]